MVGVLASALTGSRVLYAESKKVLKAAIDLRTDLRTYSPLSLSVLVRRRTWERKKMSSPIWSILPFGVAGHSWVGAEWVLRKVPPKL